MIARRFTEEVKNRVRKKGLKRVTQFESEKKKSDRKEGVIISRP